METFDLHPDDAYWVGDRYVQPMRNRVVNGGEDLSVEPRVMAVLSYLAQHAGRVVSRDELLDHVWADVVVNEDALTRAVSELRKLFDDDPRAPTVVQTVRGRGYRLIAPVRPAHGLAGDGVVGDGLMSGDGVALGNGLAGDGLAGGNGASTSIPIPQAMPASPAARRMPWHAIVLAIGGVALIALAWWAVGERADEPPARGAFAPPEPFTSYPGQEVEPAISPEGARVAFAWDSGEGEGYDVYVKQPSREEALRLTDHPAPEGSPTWSPDGSEVAFIRYGDEPGIFVVPSLGGDARRVFAVPEGAHAYSMDWSPDGTSLVFGFEPAEGTRHIWMLNLETGEAQAVTESGDGLESDRAPRFSPDGRQIAFARSGFVGGRDIIVHTLETGEERQVAENQIGVRGLDWLDADALVVASYRAGTYGLWRVELAMGEQTWVPATGEWTHSPSVASQTGALVYQDLEFEKNVWRIRLDGPGGSVLGTEPVVISTHYDCEARLSPDGERLVFASSRTGAYQVWIIDAEGQNPTAITSFDNGTAVGNPRWSSGGRHIAFSANPEGLSEVYVVDVAGGQPERVSPAGWNALLTGWTSTEDAVYFTSDQSGSWQLWRVGRDGGTPVQVTTDGALFAAESSDGQWLYVVRPDTPGIWRMALSDGQVVGSAGVVVEDFQIGWARDWVVLDAGIYYLQRGEDGLNVAFHDFATGQSRTVSEVVRIANPSLAASPDGSTLLYGRVERSESDLYVLRPDA
ncbi:MAG: winged helix-turn-helix domain-containing protein [Bacteroidota bacterium]